MRMDEKKFGIGFCLTFVVIATFLRKWFVSWWGCSVSWDTSIDRGWYYNSDPTSPYFDLKWTLRSIDVSQETLQPNQLTNHFLKNVAITTKVRQNPIPYFSHLFSHPFSHLFSHFFPIFLVICRSFFHLLIHLFIYICIHYVS